MKTPTAEQLSELGFDTAVRLMEQQRAVATPDLREKLRIAFEFYRVVEPRHITSFNAQLSAPRIVGGTRKKWRYTDRWGGDHEVTTYFQLKFTQLDMYEEIPPVEVLEKLKEAKDRGCFDYFEIATLESVKETHRIPRYVDPILFGCINESKNKYFIAQWDDDVKIEQILKEDEG